jgi:hypothetical protein
MMDAKAKEQQELAARIRQEIAVYDSDFASLDSVWDSTYYGYQEMRDELPTTSRYSYVLAAVSYWVLDVCVYPPPELMIVLAMLFKQYMDAAGDLDLETVFFGRPPQRLGTYARRAAREFAALPIDMAFLLAFYIEKAKGQSDAKSAEAAQATVEREHGECPDAETMLRRMRREKAQTRTK